ncbi:regulator [Agromyces protaetiae]|uniref:Regulator n=1 Tax=Agromyces protaetiae TaxID=2509455 RepID=A0A4P6FF99_9MICO|nr:regulator [Agromyces protaetiae]QAY74536.1 regulator [Agromyces protaetiae]
MLRIALGLDPVAEDRLLAPLVEAGHTIVSRSSGWRGVLDRLEHDRPDVVLVGAGGATLASELLEACDARGIRLVALAADDRERALATRLGLREIVDAAAPWVEIERMLHGGVPAPVASPAAPFGGPRPGPAVTAVWGPTGAPGRTLVSIALASELAAAGHSVVLVDADPYGGSVAASLGLLDEAPGFAAACRLAGADALDRAEFQRVAQRYSSLKGSFEVLSGLVGPSRWPELSEERVAAALGVLRTFAEFVVVDTGFSLERDEELTSDQFAPRRNAATFAALAAADRVVAVGVADPVGISRLLRGYGDLLEHVDPDRVDVLVNRVRASAIGIDAHGQIRETMRRFAGRDDVVLLPSDGRAADAAILAARTLRDAAPRSALRGALRAYALDRLAPAPGAPVARRQRLAFAPPQRAAG